MMKASGDTDKNKDEKATPDKEPAEKQPDRPDSAASTPTPASTPEPPSESSRASAAKSNPLRTPAESERAESEDHPEAAPDSGKEEKGAPKGRAAPAPELRISANMLQAQPQAGRQTEQEPPPVATSATKYRRRVKRLARPVEPAVINPINLIWPRANSRRGARRASRYGLVGFVLAAIWTLLEVPAETVTQAMNFSSAAAAMAVVIGAVAALALTAVGYFYHSRLAALVALAAVITLVVLDYQAEGNTALDFVGEAAIIYLLLHGVHGTIAYHIFGRRKRRKGGSSYPYKSD